MILNRNGIRFVVSIFVLGFVIFVYDRIFASTGFRYDLSTPGEKNGADSKRAGLVESRDAKRRADNPASIWTGAKITSWSSTFFRFAQRKEASKAAAPPDDAPVSRRKLILFWTTFWEHSDYYFGFGSKPFVDHGCQETRCETTNNRSRLSEADAVIFHPINIYHKRDPKSLVKDFDFPAFKPANQRWIFYNVEPPTIAFRHLDWPKFNSDDFGPIFNWTMTYRQNSDVPIPHGLTIKKEKEEKGDEINYAANKTRWAAWFVSHCHPPSKREKYVEQLKRHLPVDIFGKCGDKKCSHSRMKRCSAMLSRHYKFYLSFENSLCRDYVTDKFWRVLAQTTSVPIVLGAADYAALAPPGSFIDARKFSPKELADYLKSIDEKRYNEFHSWRKNYEVLEEWVPEGFCRLCDHLNRRSGDPPKWYEKLKDIWSEEKDCYPQLITWA